MQDRIIWRMGENANDIVSLMDGTCATGSFFF